MPNLEGSQIGVKLVKRKKLSFITWRFSLQL